MTSYRLRIFLTWPFRMAILVISQVVACIPGTTYGEVATIHQGPCQRCVGLAVKGPQEN